MFPIQVRGPLDSALESVVLDTPIDPRTCAEKNVILPFLLSSLGTFVCLLSFALFVKYFKKGANKISEALADKKNEYIEDLKLRKDISIK